jgi:hypothetical protein
MQGGVWPNPAPLGACDSYPMRRHKIPKAIQDQVVLLSRRRCCICFGLEGDLEEKDGQIAHLDRDNTNNDLDNLSFLCLLHHNKYDSKTSQSKGLRESEVKRYRKELYDKIAAGLPAAVTPTPSFSTEPADRANLHVVGVTFEGLDIDKLESFSELPADTFLMMQMTLPRPTASILMRNIGKYRVSNYVVRTAIILNELLSPDREGELFAHRSEWQSGGAIGTGNIWYPGEDKVIHTTWNQIFERSDCSELIAGNKVFYLVTKSSFEDQDGRLPDTQSCRFVSLRDRKPKMGLCWAHNT